MKLEDVLKEMWIASVKTPFGQYAEIFKNPSSKEWREVGIWPRIIADSKTKTIYVFHNFLLHQWAARELNLDMNESGLDARYVEGQINLKGNKYTLGEISFFESFEPKEVTGKRFKKFIKEFTSKDWSWLEKKYNINYKTYFNERVKLFTGGK